MPQFSRLNPVEGLGPHVLDARLVELGKGIAKVGVVAIIALRAARRTDAADSWRSAREPLQRRIGHAASLGGYALLVLSAGLLIIAAIDVPFQLWQHASDLRMTREEVREEYKESEGSPEDAGPHPRGAAALARGRMMQEVPKADVVITNPTHFAVALRYDEKRMRAPIVVAKGTDLMRREDPRNRRRAQRADRRGAAAGARAVPQRRDRRRGAGGAVRRRRAGADLRLPAEGRQRASGIEVVIS